jgi:replication initiation protein RepC
MKVGTMTDRFATSPFGGRAMSRALFLVNERVRQARRGLAGSKNDTDDRPVGTGPASASAQPADKWKLIRALTEARVHYGLSDRSIVVLEALFSFHPERLLSPAEPLVVFPSNAELSVRTRGMAPATLRRHLAALSAAGLILRRDSANGKRYAVRDDHGDIESAFGFDLGPVVLRMAEIEALADEERRLTRAIRALRGEITVHLRDVCKTIDAAMAEGRAPTIFAALQARLHALSGRVSRQADLTELKRRCDALEALRHDTEEAYLAALNEAEMTERESAPDRPDMQCSNVNMSANESFNERHIQNSKSESPFDKGSEPAEGRSMPDISEHRSGRIWQHTEAGGDIAGVALEAVLKACPQIVDYGGGRVRDWSELLKAAQIVRSMLGISPDAWARARQAMGDGKASVAIAAMLERADDIRSPGGYLRALTDRAEAGKFSVKPMLAALSTARLRAEAGG